MRNDISNIILQEIALFFDDDVTVSPGQFFGYLYPLAIVSCVVWVVEVMNIFESLLVLKVELNHTVELMSLAHSQEFDNIFALSC